MWIISHFNLQSYPFLLLDYKCKAQYKYAVSNNEHTAYLNLNGWFSSASISFFKNRVEVYSTLWEMMCVAFG